MKKNTVIVYGERFKLQSKIIYSGGRTSYFIKTKHGIRKLRQGLSDDMSEWIWYIVVNNVRHKAILETH